MEEHKENLYFASLGECNEDCLFCVRGGKGKRIKFLSTTECRRKIFEAAKEGWKHLIFDGGEPTLRLDLPELIHFAGKSGFKGVSILTNAVKLADISLARKICDVASFNNDFKLSFSISLHSYKKETSELLVGKKNTFLKTLQGIENVIKLNKPISIYHLFCRYNYKELPDFVNFLHKRFPEIKAICFSFIYPAGAARENKHIFPKLSEVEPYLHQALKKTEKYGIKFSLATCGVVPLCFFREYEDQIINQQKSEKPENVRTVDSEKDEGYQLAAGEFHRSSKLKSKRCSLCLINKLCNGIWNFYAEIHGMEELSPITDTSSFKTFVIDPGSIGNLKKEIAKYRKILFLGFTKNCYNVKYKDIITDLLEWLKKKDLNFLIKNPYPYCDLPEIPKDCKQCLDLFTTKKGDVFFCNGSRGKKITEYKSRNEIIKDFKKSKTNIKNRFYKLCPLRNG